MKIELKNIKFSEALSEETNAFTADLYINGKKVGYCRNDGRGGCTDYHAYNVQDREVIKKAEEYFKSLPKAHSERFNFDYQPTLELAIGDLLDEWLLAKEQKKMKKQMETKILVGIPNGMSYSYYNLKRPLSTLPTKPLQDAVDRIKAKLKAGEVILNTNLQALGITV
jgi:hypothetical protein